MNNIIRILPIKYIKKANMWLLNVEEYGKKSFKQLWFPSKVKAEEGKVKIQKEDELRE